MWGREVFGLGLGEGEGVKAGKVGILATNISLIPTSRKIKNIVNYYMFLLLMFCFV